MYFHGKDFFLFDQCIYILLKTLRWECYSHLSNRLSCKLFLYNLPKDLIVCWCFSYCPLCLLYFFNIILCNTSFPNDGAQATWADIFTIFNPTAVTSNVTDDVAPVLTTVSADSNMDCVVLWVLYFFFDLWFFLWSK